MSSALRFGSAVSAIVLAAMLASCAGPQVKTGFGGKADENVGLATRAMLALNAHDLPAAINFAERAVEKNPEDAGFRALLGNAYFAAGRFASAEAAYKDSLTIYSNQPQVILKLALAETALGKKDEAVAFLQAGKSVLDPSNFGLALALAGRPDLAIPVLDSAARQQGADATVRQNLALAHALAGDWQEARTIAQQDVPANQIDARIHDWMLLASPKSPSAQVAALVGVSPAAVDQGEPVRLALRKDDTMLAEAAPAGRATAASRSGAPGSAPQPQLASTAPAPVQQPQARQPARALPQFAPQVAQAAAAPAVQQQVAQAPAAPVVQQHAGPAPAYAQAILAKVDTAPAPQAVAAPAPLVLAQPPAKPVAAEAPLPTPVAMVAAAAEQVSSAAAHKLASAVEFFMPKKPVERPQAKRRLVTAAQAPRPSGPVIQLGSYRSPQYVMAAWDKLTRSHPELRAYLPMRARFDSPKGTFWRLSIQGFSNERDAIGRCELLKEHGASCFVRGLAGDAPIEFASR
jgi:Flp pilus assembly protein TadD